MVSQPPSPANNPDSALRYSDRFDFPLTLTELWFWQINTHHPKWKIRHSLDRLAFKSLRNYYFLPGRSAIITVRQQRARFSQAKWSTALRVGEALSRLPTIQAIFVTGALAMDNSPKFDDIDLMIVTSPHTLWLTRLVVVALLSLTGLRRPTSLPEHASPRVSGKTCDNLYLDTNHLIIHHRNLYTAHEILQAKVIFDRSNIHNQFLKANSWTRSLLPIAFSESLKKSEVSKLKKFDLISNSKFWISNFILSPINFLFFLIQYIYMYPKITSERVSLGYAFFHPRSDSIGSR